MREVESGNLDARCRGREQRRDRRGGGGLQPHGRRAPGARVPEGDVRQVREPRGSRRDPGRTHLARGAGPGGDDPLRGSARLHAVGGIDEPRARSCATSTSTSRRWMAPSGSTAGSCCSSSATRSRRRSARRSRIRRTREMAVRAALDMRRRLAAWNAARERAGKIPLRHGIGIHTGSVLAGNIGSAERHSYALVGDPVNLASRIQSLTKEFGSDILVSARHSPSARLPLRPRPAPGRPRQRQVAGGRGLIGSPDPSLTPGAGWRARGAWGPNGPRGTRSLPLCGWAPSRRDAPAAASRERVLIDPHAPLARHAPTPGSAGSMPADQLLDPVCGVA